MTKIPRPQQLPVPKLQCVIGDEVYDTETASVLYHDRKDHKNMLFAFGSVLMLSLTERYFIVDYNETGAPHSVWLRPVTIQEAVFWAVLHCADKRQIGGTTLEIIEGIFGRMNEPGEGPAYTPSTSSPELVLDKWLRLRKDNPEEE